MQNTSEILVLNTNCNYTGGLMDSWIIEFFLKRRKIFSQNLYEPLKKSSVSKFFLKISLICLLTYPLTGWGYNEPTNPCQKNLTSIDERVERKWKLQFFRFLKRTAVTEIFLQASKPLTRATPYSFHQDDKIAYKNQWYLLYADYAGISNSQGIYHYAETLPNPENTFLNLRLLQGPKDSPSDDMYFLRLDFKEVESPDTEANPSRQRIVTYETIIDVGSHGSFRVTAQLAQAYWPLQPKSIRNNPWISTHVLVKFSPNPN
jgi:hypothetical protein